MRMIIKDRGKGKTTQMIYTSASTGIPILVEHYSMAKHIQRMADELEVIIPEVLIVSDLQKRGGLKPENVLVDEGYDIIDAALKAYLGTNVVAITLTDRIKENAKRRTL